MECNNKCENCEEVMGQWGKYKWGKTKVKCSNAGKSGCGIWLVGWLFTIGFLQLTFWKGVLALIIWPYYLGVFASSFVKIM